MILTSESRLLYTCVILYNNDNSHNNIVYTYQGVNNNK